MIIRSGCSLTAVEIDGFDDPVVDFSPNTLFVKNNMEIMTPDANARKNIDRYDIVPRFREHRIFKMPSYFMFAVYFIAVDLMQNEG
jgi:hypothetical protein